MSTADNFIFWCAPSTEEEDDVGFEDELPIEEDRDESDPKGKGKARESMYVSLVEAMVKTVLDKESFLFSEDELAFFTTYSTLSYKARYLLARLLVRKTGKWYRLDQLKYVSELGTEGIIEAMKELCGTLGSSLSASTTASSKSSQDSAIVSDASSRDTEIIDLISDDEEQERINSISLPKASSSSQSTDAFELSFAASKMKSNDNELGSMARNHRGVFDFYAEDESIAPVSELLKCLTVEELKGLARTLKLSTALTTRNALIDALLASSSSQTTLGGFASSATSRSKKSGKDSKSVHLKQALLSFAPKNRSKLQMEVLRGMVLKILKKCIRVNDAINALFHRLHIIYFRSTEHPTSLLTPALLRRCRKRYYPLYTYVRTPEIFTSREALVAYEEALRMEAAVDLMLEGNIDVELAQEHIDAWANGREKDATLNAPPPHTLRGRASSPTDINDGGKENQPDMRMIQARNRSVSVLAKVEVDDEPPEANVKESQTIANARYIVSVFERVYPRWQELVEQRGELDARPHGLERFDEGYILTRIVYKGATAYGKLKNFDRELELLRELLAQRRWRRGKRGAWYDRWALVLMHHLPRLKREVNGELLSPSKDEQKKFLEEAMDIVIRGLHDDDTHIVSRQALEHRLSRLEKRLRVPLKKRHDCVGKLQKAVETKITGERVRQRSALGKIEKVANKAAVPVSVQIQGEEAVRKHLDQAKKERQKEKWTGKSLWYGKCGEEVNVETLVLHHYELDDYKGFHSEASIVSTIWGLLFWDILFSSVPGAFETPYQSAPLDIASECFFFARKDAIEERLLEIKNGKAPEILGATDDKYRENNTMCVGVRWNDYKKQDLVEIATCIGGVGLSVVCRLFCEDYGGRHSGIPDLIVWRMRDRLAKFVEVKGPGDNLSENQKVWIDVLLQAGINVEVCRVTERVTEQEKANAQAMRNFPKKHRVIRVYRIDEGDDDIPIDVDEGEGGRTEPGEETNEHPRKRQRTEEYEVNMRQLPAHGCSLSEL
ncbi:VRR-NUC domain-containing protein [Phellopilus nigrolimitatus]|nr:VRR-NUC domain-containing protein [Phellopilus nigrolimitatus]